MRSGLTRMAALCLAGALCALAQDAPAQTNPLQAKSDVGGHPDIPELIVDPGPPHAIRGPAHVGEELTVRISITARHPFLALVWAPPEITGAEVRTLVKPRTKRFEAVGGGGWRLEMILSVIPDASGPLIIPPVTARGKLELTGGGTLPFGIRTTLIRIPVAPAPEAARIDWWVAARTVQVTETWSIPPDALRLGDRTRRRVEVLAHGVPEHRLPLLDMTGGQGAQVTDLGATRVTEVTPTGVQGRIVHEWDVTIATDEVTALSPVGFRYWDTDGDHPALAFAPKARVEPLPADLAALTAEVMGQAAAERSALRLGIALLTALPLLAVLALLILIWDALRLRPADLALRLALGRAGAGPQEDRTRERAVLDWAAWVGDARTLTRTAAALPEAAPALRALEHRLYGIATPPIQDLAPTLLRAARRHRLRRRLASIGGIWSALAGRARDLPPD